MFQPIVSVLQSILAFVSAQFSGWQTLRIISAATNNKASLRSRPTLLGGWYITNTNAAVRYVKLYDRADVPDPTCTTCQPILTLAIPGNTAGAGTNIDFGRGIEFRYGLGILITTNVDDGTTQSAVAASEIVVNLFYK